jgi:hypothetical protein
VHLQPLLVFRWSYEEDVRVKTGFTIVSPYGTKEGIAYGEGRGTAAGRIGGSVVWSNYPRRRTDGRMLPNLRGLISTDDAASIPSSFAGEQYLKATRDGRTSSDGSSQITRAIAG